MRRTLRCCGKRQALLDAQAFRTLVCEIADALGIAKSSVGTTLTREGRRNDFRLAYTGGKETEYALLR